MRFSVLNVGLLLVAGAAAGATLPSALALGPAVDVAIFFVSTATFVGGAIRLAWRDLYLFAVLAAVLATVALASVGLVASIDAPTAGRVVSGIVAALVLAAALAFILRSQFHETGTPDILAELFGLADVYETGGVQLVMVLPVSAPANAIVPFELYLQNCMGAERTVTIELDDKPLFGRGERIRWRRPPPVVVAASEVRVVRIPICAARADKLSATVHVHVRATGPTGKRIRTRRAQYAVPPLRAWQFVPVALLAFPLLGELVFEKGGLQKSIYFFPAAPLRNESELPEVAIESIWSEN